MNDHASIVVSILEEVERAQITHRPFPTQPLRALSILTEEVLEATRATLRLNWELAYDLELGQLRVELVQVAAVCVMWLERIHEEQSGMGVRP